MANIACLVNQTGPLYVHPKGIVKRSHFHAMAMYANLLQAQVAKTQVNSDRLTADGSSVALVDAIATVDESGKKWAVALMNRHPSQEVACTLMMAERPLDGTVEASLLTGDSPDSYNDIEHPDRVVPKDIELTFNNGSISLPPHSLVIFEVLLQK